MRRALSYVLVVIFAAAVAGAVISLVKHAVDAMDWRGHAVMGAGLAIVAIWGLLVDHRERKAHRADQEGR